MEGRLVTSDVIQPRATLTIFGLPWHRLLVYGFLFGVGYATLQAEISRKADAEPVAAMARDIADVKYMLCQNAQYRINSACRGVERAEP